jgi:rubrerythrin
MAPNGGLDMDFLRNMQSALEDLGYDLTSQNIMEQLASDQTVAARLLPLLLTSSSSTTGSDGATMAEWVRQWQQAIQEQMEVEKQLAKKQQRPVWRCRVCGSYGCPVAPYIEYMEDVG